MTDLDRAFAATFDAPDPDPHDAEVERAIDSITIGLSDASATHRLEMSAWERMQK